MNEFKSKIRQEWKPQPIKQMFHQFIGLLVIVAVIFLSIKFGLIAAGVFVTVCALVSIISLIAQGKPKPKKDQTVKET